MIRQLHNCVLFQQFEYEQLENLISRIPSRVVNTEKGEILIEEGQHISEIGIVLSGELCESKYFVDGSEQLMQKLRQYYMVGVEAAFSPRKTSPYHIYATKDSRIYLIPMSVLEKSDILTEEERRTLYQACASFLASGNIRRYKKIELLSVKNARERVYRYLCFQREKNNSNKFSIGFDREQMANYLGLNRSVLSHTLKKMENEGFLKVSKNKFELLDRFDEALKE
ncbi:MAG: Crp/Fnr family transcriptional regulator [Schaedlerella sp.]|nr:Crp/Fnr family transcriptional regulator [Schaedlerella sp.]